MARPRPSSARRLATTALARAALLAATALAAAACVFPATELRVVVSTDVDPTVPLTLAVRAFRGREGGRMVMAHAFRRALPGEGPDAGFALPASFTVVPGDTPRDGFVRIEVEADADGTLLRRIVVVPFTPQRTGVVRVFLAARCADPAVGCRGAPCTQRLFCEEQNLTCGDRGTCVPTEVEPSRDLDAGFDDVGPPPTCGRPGESCCSIGAPCRGENVCAGGRCSDCPPGSEACCAGGVARPDGTECAATTDPCRRPGTCTAGVCSPVTDAPDGTECAPAASACDLPSVCVAGACTARPAPDGTECAPAPDACSLPSVCAAGVCTDRRAPDGTECAPPANPCEQPSVCVAGACTRRAVADGTVCAMASGGCMRNGVCMAGVCTGTSPLPDGTVCAMAGNPCQRDGTCRAGVCSGTMPAPDGTVCAPAANNCRLPSVCVAGACTQRNVANGTVCAPTSDPCRASGTCNAGACGPITNRPNGTVCAPQNTAACDAARVCSGGVCQPAAPLPNGTVCRPAANACQQAARCSSGTCPANPRDPDNTVVSATQRCCGGVPTSITTASNCGVCDLRCASGNCVGRSIDGATRYLCTCTSNAMCAPLSTCRTQTPNANVCACTSDAQCPGSAVCVDASFNPNYCR